MSFIFASRNTLRYYNGRWPVHVRMGAWRVCTTESDPVSYVAKSRRSWKTSMESVATDISTMFMWRISVTWLTTFTWSLAWESAGRMAMVVCIAGRENISMLGGQVAFLFCTTTWTTNTAVKVYLWRAGWAGWCPSASVTCYGALDGRWHFATNRLFRFGKRSRCQRANINKHIDTANLEWWWRLEMGGRKVCGCRWWSSTGRCYTVRAGDCDVGRLV